jgi:hypothetical protein
MIVAALAVGLSIAWIWAKTHDPADPDPAPVVAEQTERRSP